MRGRGSLESRRLLRLGLPLSLALHLLAVFLPWGTVLDSGTPPPGQGGPFQVTLFEAPGDEPGEVEAVPEEEPDPEAPPEAPEVAEPEDAMTQTAPRTETPTLPPRPAIEPSGESTGEGTSTPLPAGAAAGDPAGKTAPTGEQAVFEPPRLLAGALPIDPEDSEELDVPEEIPVRLRIGKDGRVREIVPGNPDLPGAVMRALQRSAGAMRFVPARRGGKPVEAWFSMTFVYRR